ncbi:hypothetical protein FGO68_gene17744 [Halteria grandinella]|uniref:Lysozyme n=1 Tax=Halteria grandinella TaxID=5974 RepID=A0A8J8SYT8_HALGN|nr:hypothetical protein FGO68_gene17744 [Halteria grandinella]
MDKFSTPSFNDHLSLIKHFEGYKGTTYKCPADVNTIGYGHTGKDVVDGMKITQEQGEKFLKEELKEHRGHVEKQFKGIPLKENQIGALTSFCYNVGPGNLNKSTLKKRILAGEDPNKVAKEELPKWNKAAGKELPGLSRRREAEAALFCK